MLRFQFIKLLSALLFSVSCIAMEQKIDYRPNAFLNTTLNNMGYEIKPFAEFSQPCLKQISDFVQDKSRSCRILEVGGAYGRFLRQIFTHLGKENASQLHYDFCELNPGHTKMAQLLFDKEFPHYADQVTFRTGDAIQFLKESESTYQVIIISNVLHYLSPTQLLDMTRLMNDKLDKDGIIYGMAMTPYYNPHKGVTEKIRAKWPAPIIPGEELNRQIFERLRQINFAFPGYPGVEHSLAKKQEINYVDESLLTTVFTAVGLQINKLFEFSIIDDNYYSSKHRWVVFVLAKGQNMDPSSFNSLYERAQKEEKSNKAFYNNIMKMASANASELYRQWFSYLTQCGVPSVSQLTLAGDILVTKK